MSPVEYPFVKPWIGRYLADEAWIYGSQLLDDVFGDGVSFNNTVAFMTSARDKCIREGHQMHTRLGEGSRGVVVTIFVTQSISFGLLG